MSKAEEYQSNYKECFYVTDNYNREGCIIESLSSLIEEMIETIRELEESASKEYKNKRLKLEAFARTGIKNND